MHCFPFCGPTALWGVCVKFLSTVVNAHSVLVWKPVTLDFYFCLEQKTVESFWVFWRLQIDCNGICITGCAQQGFWTLLLLA